MIEQVYNNNFADRYNIFLINYANDQENDFIQTYNLTQPLEVVLVQINAAPVSAIANSKICKI